MKKDVLHHGAVGVFIAFGVLLVAFGGCTVFFPEAMRSYYQGFIGLTSPTWDVMGVLSLVLGAVLIAGARPGPLRYWFVTVGTLTVLKGVLLLIPHVAERWMAVIVQWPTLSWRWLGLLYLAVGVLILWESSKDAPVRDVPGARA